jgi:tRNA-2-methylthio-N6-dimethylallyladenosine synthase
MFRGYTAEEYYTFIDEIRKRERNISITTDIIVGFSDETDEDFQQTLKLCKYSNFDMIFIGIYSSRPGTYAHQKLQDNIPYKLKHQRRDQLNELLKIISKTNNQEEI